MRALAIGFWVDPVQSLRPGHDSSLALMAEAVARGHRVFCFESKDLWVERGVCRIRSSAVFVSREAQKPTVIGTSPLSVDDLDLVFLRKDPPVDMAYAHATRLLEFGAVWPFPRFINSPVALRELNEKLIALQFPDLSPHTVVSADKTEVEAAREQFGVVVLKPLDGCGGQDVFKLHPGEDATEAWAVVTGGGARPAIIQQFVPGVVSGDKRIIVWNGEPLGAILRVAKKGEFRCNFALGARPQKTELDERDREICNRLAPYLIESGLMLVGIDVVGGMLTEVNITSPTGLVEIDQANGARLEARILDDCERMVGERLEPMQQSSTFHSV